MNENYWALVIAVGDPFDGMKLFGAEDGNPFYEYDEAVEYAEKEFRNSQWSIVPIHVLTE